MNNPNASLDSVTLSLLSLFLSFSPKENLNFIENFSKIYYAFLQVKTYKKSQYALFV